MWSLATLLFLAFFQQTDFSADGVKALENNKYEEAAQLLQKAVEADPKDYYSLFYLAQAYSALGKPAEAAQAYTKVLEIKPGLYEAELNLGIVLLSQKQPGEALPHLRAAVEKKPEEARPNLFLGDALFDTGAYAEAEQCYRKALALDAKSAAATLGVGRSLAKQGKLDEAAPLYRTAAELDARLKNALLEMADLYEKAQRSADAVAIYQQFPENPAARERAGALLLEAGKAADAVADLEDAVRRSPTAANRLALAIAYTRSNQPDKALAVLEEAVKAEPDNLELRFAYGRSLRDKRNFPAAAQEFYRIVQARPDSVEAWNELASMLLSMNRLPQALAALDRLKSMGAEIPGHLYLRAMILDKMKDQKGALASYEAFLARSEGKHPDEEFISRQRARILRKELERR